MPDQPPPQYPGLFRTDLEAFDPRAAAAAGGSAAERRFCCPLPACAEKPRDAAHRSLSVNLGTGAWHCHRCGTGGILAEHRKEAEREAFAEGRGPRAKRRRSFQPPPPQRRPLQARYDAAAATSRQETPAESASPLVSRSGDWRAALRGLRPVAGTIGEKYLAERRHLPAAFCHANGIRFAPSFYGRPAVVFPVRDSSGQLVAAQGRYIDGRSNPKARTVGPRSRGVFYTQGALQENTPPVLVEAPVDALSLALCGLPAVALCGKEGLPDDLCRAWAFRTVYVAFDADEEGDRAAVKMASRLTAVGAQALRLRPESGAKDWNDLLLLRGVEPVRAALAESVGAPFTAAAAAVPSDDLETDDTAFPPLEVARMGLFCLLTSYPAGEWVPVSALEAAEGLGEATAGVAVTAALRDWPSIEWRGDCCRLSLPGLS